MKRSSLLFAFSITVLLVGCGDESVQEKPQKIEKISNHNEKEVQKKQPVIVAKEEEKIILLPKEEQKIVVESKSILENAILPIDELESLNKKTSLSSKKEIAVSVAKVEAARATAAVEIVSAVSAVETLTLEDNESAHGDPASIERNQKEAAKKIEEAVYKVEAAKAAASATIAQSVKSVDDAEAARSATSPHPAATIQEAKERARATIAKSVASVEVAKAKAASSMAKSVAKVEMNERLYGEDSLEAKAVRAKATGEIAEVVGNVKVAEASSLATISESVAEVEIAKAQAGIIRDSVIHGQKIYLKKLKKACGMNGAEFAALHSQVEWEEIRNIGSFGHEVEKRCPKLDTFKEKWESDLFDFCYEYAKDSGNVPSCG